MIEKDALQYVVELGNTKLEVINGQTFSTQKLHAVEHPTPKAINVRSLQGFVDYLKSDFDAPYKLLVQIVSPTEVIAFTGFNSDYKRNYLIQAQAMLPEFRYEHFYGAEEFNIKLQSGFLETDSRNKVLKLVGNISEEHVKTVGDNGISQSVVARTGVTVQESVLVPNPVRLTPFRTFVEVAQPESEFIFRVKSGPVLGLFEADGGAWKLFAMANVKEYLALHLADQIEVGKLNIIS